MIIKEGGTNSLIDMQKIKPIDFLETIEKHSEILRNNVTQIDDNRLKDREIKNSQITMWLKIKKRKLYDYSNIRSFS